MRSLVFENRALLSAAGMPQLNVFFYSLAAKNAKARDALLSLFANACERVATEDMTVDVVMSKAYTFLTKTRDVDYRVADVLLSVWNDDDVETAVLQALNRALPSPEPLSPWKWLLVVEPSGGWRIKFQFAGETADSSEWTQDAEDRRSDIESWLKSKGAGQVSVSVRPDRGPWNGAQTVQTYSGQCVIPFHFVGVLQALFSEDELRKVASESL